MKLVLFSLVSFCEFCNNRLDYSTYRLHCLFQGTLLPALDLVDNRSVTVVSCPAGRQVYQVSSRNLSIMCISFHGGLH